MTDVIMNFLLLPRTIAPGRLITRLASRKPTCLPVLDVFVQEVRWQETSAVSHKSRSNGVWTEGRRSRFGHAEMNGWSLLAFASVLFKDKAASSIEGQDNYWTYCNRTSVIGPLVSSIALAWWGAGKAGKEGAPSSWSSELGSWTRRYKEDPLHSTSLLGTERELARTGQGRSSRQLGWSCFLSLSPVKVWLPSVLGGRHATPFCPPSLPPSAPNFLPRRHPPKSSSLTPSFDSLSSSLSSPGHPNSSRFGVCCVLVPPRLRKHRPIRRRTLLSVIFETRQLAHLLLFPQPPPHHPGSDGPQVALILSR